MTFDFFGKTLFGTRTLKCTWQPSALETDAAKRNVGPVKPLNSEIPAVTS